MREEKEKGKDRRRERAMIENQMNEMRKIRERQDRDRITKIKEKERRVHETICPEMRFIKSK